MFSNFRPPKFIPPYTLKIYPTMAVLLFEGDEDLKIHTADLSDNTVKIVVENHATDATNIHTEHKLDLADLRVLEAWISDQRRAIEKNTNK